MPNDAPALALPEAPVVATELNRLAGKVRRGADLVEVARQMRALADLLEAIGADDLGVVVRQARAQRVPWKVLTAALGKSRSHLDRLRKLADRAAVAGMRHFSPKMRHPAA